MPLAPGTRVGPYEVLGSLGAGGMGEVYRARDTKLDREVALKVLPDVFASDSDRLLRFDREAKVLASLNHPHIAHIHGLETSGAAPVLALELVEGDTLADRIARGPIPLDETVAIAKQIAQALEHAHEKAIVHRDLKPANIKVSPSGVVKVLDFGLARAMTSEGTASAIASPVSSPTITSPVQMTRAGIILGTAAYMAPEQARGKMVDQRADIWAFGCVVYEMLSGRRAFGGDEMTDVLARVIEREPDWNLLPRTTPRPLTRLLHRCLRKDPAARLHSIADARLELEEVQQGTAPDVSDAVVAVPHRASGWPRVLAGAAIGAALTAATMLGLSRRSTEVPPSQVLRYSLKTPPGTVLGRADLSTTGRVRVAVSPDGQKLAVVLVDDKARRRVWIRRFDETSFREIPDTDGAQFAFWARDSERIGFGGPSGVRETSIAGVNSRVLMSAGPSAPDYTWGPGDVLLFSGPSTLLKLSSAAGKPESASELAADEQAHGFPVWLPDGKGFLYLSLIESGRLIGLNYRSLAGPATRLSVFESTGPGSNLNLAYQSGHVLLTRAENSGRVNLTAQPLDLATLRLTGQPTLLAADVNPSFSASDRILVLGHGGAMSESLDWVDEKGTVTSNAVKPASVFNFDLSPDERFIVLHLLNPTMLAVHDTVRGVTSTLISGSDPIWSPDGRQIAYSIGGAEPGVYVIPAFGGDRRLILKREPGIPVYPEDWSKDGRWVAAVREQSKEKQGIVIPVDGKSEPVVIARETTNGVDELRFSPDGRFIAYGVTSGSVPRDVFLVPNPPTGERWQVSVNGGAQPRWRDDGKALYYLSPSGALMVVDIRTTPNSVPDISAPRALFNTGIIVNAAVDQFDVGRQGKRFLLRRPSATLPDELQVIVNWPELLKKSQ